MGAILDSRCRLVGWSVRRHFLWLLFLRNHLMEFHETSQEWLIQSLVLHAVILSRFSEFWMSYGPLNFSYIVHILTYLMNTISQQPFDGISCNFTKMIDTKLSCACCNPVPVRWFLNELWPLELFIHSAYMDISCEHYFLATLCQNLI